MKSVMTTICILMLQGLLYSPTVNSTELVLSTEEKQWLTEHPVIRLSPNPVFAPIEEVNSDGEYIGMAADYMALIEKKVNVEFTIVGYPSWKKVIEQARQKNVDVLATLARSSQREAYLNFTTAYINLPGMIFVNDQIPGRVTMDDLKNMNVATPAGDAWRDLIANNHPGISLLEAANLTQGLLDLSSGLLDAVIADPAAVTNVVRKQGISNLRIGGETGYYINFTFAVRKDWPVLIDILEKAIQSISEQEHQAIFDKWVEFKVETGLSKNVQIGLLIAGLVVIVLAIGFVFMHAMIRIRVVQQTGELDGTNAKLFEINAELEQRLIAQTRELEKARNDLTTSQVNMVQSEKMAALGQMIAGIANEINTPLGYSRSNVMIMKEFASRVKNIETIFSTWKNLMSDGFASEDDIANQFLELDVIFSEMIKNDEIEECAELAADTLYGLDQIAEITQNLKDFSKLDQTETADVNINDNIERTLKLAKNLLSDHIDVKLSLGQVPLIKCNSSKINQVLLNLITNACHAINVSGKDKGILAIKTHFDDDLVKISIKDNGEGIAQDVGKKIFDPFYTTKGAGQGTGLGLSIGYNIIVKEHKGKISVHTREGFGTKITISLHPETSSNLPEELITAPQNGLSPE